MIKLYINSRDELNILPLEKIMFAQSEDNYTRVTYVSGHQVLVHLSLTKFVELITKVWPKGTPSPFYRLGRGLLVNQQFVIGINILRQRITLTAFGDKVFTLSAPKVVLKNYRDLLTQVNKR